MPCSFLSLGPKAQMPQLERGDGCLAHSFQWFQTRVSWHQGRKGIVAEPGSPGAERSREPRTSFPGHAAVTPSSDWSPPPESTFSSELISGFILLQSNYLPNRGGFGDSLVLTTTILNWFSWNGTEGQNVTPILISCICFCNCISSIL